MWGALFVPAEVAWQMLMRNLCPLAFADCTGADTECSAALLAIFV
jgi:hypothetical protein